jgi:hypothetical protein
VLCKGESFVGRVGLCRQPRTISCETDKNSRAAESRRGWHKQKGFVLLFLCHPKRVP